MHSRNAVPLESKCKEIALRRRKHLGFLLAAQLALIAACAGDPPTMIVDETTKGPQRGPSSNSYSYMAGITGGDLYPYFGELYPSGPLQAKIVGQSTVVGITDCSGGPPCDANVGTFHSGIWLDTEKILQLRFNGAAGPGLTQDDDACTSLVVMPEDFGFGGPTPVCFQKQSMSDHEVSLNCGISLSGVTQHHAWWLGVISFTVGGEFAGVQYPGGRYGLTTKTSTSASVTAPACPPSGGGGGGPSNGSGGMEVCYDAYAVYSDAQGNFLFEIYLGEVCFEEYAT